MAGLAYKMPVSAGRLTPRTSPGKNFPFSGLSCSNLGRRGCFLVRQPSLGVVAVGVTTVLRIQLPISYEHSELLLLPILQRKLISYELFKIRIESPLTRLITAVEQSQPM